MSKDTGNGSWAISGLWNDLVTADRTIEPRDYIRASEIGKPYLDRWLAMRGIQPTNPFPARVKRIFDSGLIFEIDVVERIFRLLGILQEAQKQVWIEKPGLLKISGHFDHKVGGKINEEQAREAIAQPYVSDWMRARSEALLERLLVEYPDGLKTVIAEIKTVNSNAFWSHKNTDPQTGFFRGYDHHKLQLFTYLVAEEEDEGRLFYISKDDLTVMESGIFRNQKALEDLWNKDIEEMTAIYQSNVQPEREEDIVWSKTKQMWELNWKISRSPYFTYLTEYQTPEEWAKALAPKLKQLNTKPCKGCKIDYMLMTLNKKNGYCAKCAKKNAKEVKDK